MEESKCPICEGSMVQKKVLYSFAGLPLGRFDADVCQACGEVFFTETAWKDIERTAKRKHVWGAGRRVKVGVSGHSLIVRIPVAVADAVDLEQGQTVFVQPAGKGRLVLEKE